MNTLERAAINISTLIVGVSGLAFAVMKYLMESDDPFSVINHPLQPWMLDTHVLAAPVMLLALGWIAREHILEKLTKRNGNGKPGRRTGVIAVSCLLPMISTGYLIQVFTNEMARQICVLVHLSTGIAYLAVFMGHLIATRAAAAHSRARRQAPPSVSVTPMGFLRGQHRTARNRS